MTTARISRVWGTIILTITICFCSLSAYAKYSGGTGEPNDPYQIATAVDLIALGETPEDYDKHFILTADIDLDPNLPGGKVFDGAVIAPEGGRYFRGIFDGNSHTISGVRIIGNKNYLGLFGQLASAAEVKNLGVMDVNMTSSAGSVGGLAGYNGGSVTQCYSNGTVDGKQHVGGLVGINDGTVARCHSRNMVSGTGTFVGGLVGYNAYGSSVTQCYSTGAVSGNSSIGGLVGYNSMAAVTQCFWDIQTSGQTESAGGTGKTTTEMQTASTFLDAGWDFIGETENGTDDIWKIAEGLGYPRLAWEKYSGGRGEPNDPYQIATAADLIALGETPEDYDKHFILTDNIDLDPNLPGGKVFDRAIIAPDISDTSGRFDGTPFTGVFDGNGHTISHLTIKGVGYLGLFGQVGAWDAPASGVRNLGVIGTNITGSIECVGGLVGYSFGNVAQCYSTGSVSGRGNTSVGGLLGVNGGNLANCSSTGIVIGDSFVGGLVGLNGGTVVYCYSTSAG